MGIVTLNVVKPLVGYSYKIYWSLPSILKPPHNTKEHNEFLKDKYYASRISNILLERKEDIQKKIASIFESIKLFLIKADIDEKESVDISLMVFREYEEKEIETGKIEVVYRLSKNTSNFKLNFGAGVLDELINLKKLGFIEKDVLMNVMTIIGDLQRYMKKNMKF